MRMLNSPFICDAVCKYDLNLTKKYPELIINNFSSFESATKDIRRNTVHTNIQRVTENYIFVEFAEERNASNDTK